MRLFLGKSTPAIRAISPAPYPCLCLWRVFEQTTRTTPFLRITLHLLQIFLTDALTFMLSLPVNDATARQVVRRQLHPDFIARQNLDVVHAHLARDMREHFMAVVELDAK